MADRFDWDRWASDDDGWDTDTGAPGIGLFAKAIQVWSTGQLRPTSLAEAARVFNCDPARVIEAVEFHPFMYFSGPDDDYTRRLIEHDGE